MSQASSAKKACTSSTDEDRISTLPDEVLELVLGFLPADQAVRTSVLAPRWRYLWRSMRRLRVKHYELGKTIRGFGEFLNRLLLLRDPGSTLDEVDIVYDQEYDEGGIIGAYTNIWIRHALLCQTRALSVHPIWDHSDGEVPELEIPPYPLVSPHLAKLELHDMVLKGSILDFTSCPTLEDLRMEGCYIFADKISSQSMKLLVINHCHFKRDSRTCISVPSLTWLQIYSFYGKSPVLESMPSLETAYVKPSLHNKEDYCNKGDSEECCGICANCSGNDDHNGATVLLGGLSNAKILMLEADSGMLIFRRDMGWCPVFSKLKTLFLNEWSVAIDFRALVGMLEHSPVLKNLTLQLRKGHKHITDGEANHILKKKSAAISEHLKIIKVVCEVVDERVCQILKFFTKFGREINIKRDRSLRRIISPALFLSNYLMGEESD